MSEVELWGQSCLWNSISPLVGVCLWARHLTYFVLWNGPSEYQLLWLERAQQLRALIISPEDPRFVAITHVRKLPTACNSKSRRSDVLFRSPWALHDRGALACMQATVFWQTPSEFVNLYLILMLLQWVHYYHGQTTIIKTLNGCYL